MKIRRYVPSDRAACHTVYVRAVREGTVQFYNAAQRAAWAPSDHPDPDRPDGLRDQLCWVAEDDGGIQGFMSMTLDGHIDMAFVVPDAMGTGLSKRLYEQLLQDARTREFQTLTVDASHLAQRFFQRHGFETDYREDIERNGVMLERFRMSRPLTEKVQ